MRSCILHVGMPKTGTSSIQDYLYHRLRDRRFRYISFGEENGSRALTTVFLNHPDRYWLHRRMHLSSGRVKRLGTRYRKLLEHGLKQCRRQGTIPILSGEGCWHLDESELTRLRTLLATHGFEARVVAYLRPHLPWLESAFQQNAKFGNLNLKNNPFVRVSADYLSHLNYLSRLDRMAAAFGESNLTIRAFQREHMLGGCAVRDFCDQIGVDAGSAPIARENEAISLDAVRFLYTYFHYIGRFSPPPPWQNSALIRHLQCLDGDSLRLHPSLLAPIADRLARENQAIQTRFGIDLRPDQRRRDAPDGLRCEDDLFRYSSRSLAWLEQQSGCGPLRGEGDARARQVAAAVDRLRWRAVWSQWRPILREYWRRHARRWRH